MVVSESDTAGAGDCEVSTSGLYLLLFPVCFFGEFGSYLECLEELILGFEFTPATGSGVVPFPYVFLGNA